MDQQNQERPEVLFFTKGDTLATIVTNGAVTRVYEPQETQIFGKLSQAVAHLEVRGYRINMNQEVK